MDEVVPCRRGARRSNRQSVSRSTSARGVFVDYVVATCSVLAGGGVLAADVKGFHSQNPPITSWSLILTSP